jgi:cytochrome c556
MTISFQSRGVVSFCALALLCATTFIAARAEQRLPGLTGIDHAADVVQARQLLMTQIDEEMQPVDLAAGGKDFPLDELKSNANRISIMLGAFPHLFPPQTKPGPDEFSTAAAPAIWQDFETFYGQTDAATKLAYDASQATAIDQFRDSAKKLRVACDGCHAKYMKVDSPTPP